MKRKYEDSPARSCERNRKVSSLNKKFEKSKNLSLYNSSKKSSNPGVGLRRSSRKATIERRVWAEPRREKNWKLTKSCSAVVSKRGRPPKRTHASKILLNSTSEETVLNKHCNNDCYIRELPLCENNVPVLIESGRNGSHSSDNEDTFVDDDDNNREGTLIIDDEVASLQGAVVEEVVQDYPHKISNSLEDSQYKPKNLYEISSNSCISQTIFINKGDKASSISSVSSEEVSNYKDDLLFHSKSKESLTCDAEIKNTSNCVKEEIYEDEIKKRGKDILEFENDLSKEMPIEYEDDNHVSLSEALAKLVESEEPGQNNELETVTIHPVTFHEEAKSLYSPHITLSNIPVRPVATSFTPTSDDTVLNARCLNSREVGLMRSCTDTKVELSSMDIIVNPIAKPRVIGKPNPSSASLSQEEEEGNEKSYFEGKESASAKTLRSNGSTPSARQISKIFRKQNAPPPLVKIANKPLVFKTPLQCCECSMRFCTVRSLLWHFGTHEPALKKKENSEIILENLITAWDRPDVPLQLPNTFEHDISKVEKLANCKEFSCNSLSSLCESKTTKCQKYVDESPRRGNGVSRDFILKVPIPRLKRLGINNSFDNDNYFDDIKYPTMPCINRPDITISPTPCVSILPGASYPPPASTPEASFSITLTPCPPRSLQSDCGLLTNQSPLLSTRSISPPCEKNTSQLWPHSTLTASTTLTISTQPSTSEQMQSGAGVKSESKVTVIPVEKLGQLRNRIRNGMSSDIFGSEKPDDESKSPSSESFLEENGLVVINRSLALRIINASTPDKQSYLEAPSNLSETSCLTILPQSKNDSLSINGRPKSSPPTPDILTIVPQIDPSKQSRKSSCTPTLSPPQLMTAIGKVTPDSSKVVKLILVPPKREVFPEKKPALLPPEADFDWSDESSDVESDEGGMVIDVKEEEGTTMDPLSLCTVTMDEEDLETKSNLFDQSKEFCRDSLACVPASGVESLSNDTSGKRVVPKLDEEKYLKRKYVCEFCQKRFGWSTDLKRHVILHTGERPFKCKWCPITFTRKFLLQNHMKKIHSQLCKWSDLWE